MTRLSCIVGGSQKGGQDDMADATSAETFMAHIGEAISLRDGPTLTLVAVDRHKSPAPSGAFTLLLRGAPAPIAPEGMHCITLEGGASFDLYLIPIHTPSRDHQDYQIVFN
jgi:hypothetical protein